MKRIGIIPLFGLGLLFLTGLVLAGCQPQPIATYYKGYQADRDKIVSLDPAPSQGHWKTFDLGIDYQLKRQGDNLKISGAARHGLHYELTTSRILALDLYLYFLDKNDKVLATTLLSSVRYDSPDAKIPFADNLKIPAGATAFAFGYEGRARQDNGIDADHGGGGTEYYFNLPKRPENG